MKIFDRMWMCIKVATQLLGINFQIVRGLWLISALPRPCVSIFGGSKNFQNDEYYKKLASRAAELLVRHNISVLTGGGPGIMEAANCGAHATQRTIQRTLKIVIEGLPFDEKPNTCPGESVYVTNFIARKWLLIDYSVGFIIFPGGLGTMDEISDLMNLMQTGKIKRRTVVLIGVDYWAPYKTFFDQAKTEKFLSEYPPGVVVTDDIEHAVQLVIAHCDTCVYPNGRKK